MFMRVLESFGEFWRVNESLEEFGRVWKSLREFRRVFESFTRVLGEFLGEFRRVWGRCGCVEESLR